MPQAMKIPAAKKAVDKEWEKLEKISAWNLTKVKSKKEVIDEARTSGATVHFASLMDISHLKNAELEAKHQKYKGRVVLRGDIVKDNSGSYAVFTEQGSSASQMTAAKIMDIISRLPGCDGQAADAVSAYTQVKMEDAHKLLKVPKSECPDIWIRLPRHKMAKIMVQQPDNSKRAHFWPRRFKNTNLIVISLQCQCLNRLVIERGDLWKPKPIKSQKPIKRRPRLNGVTCVTILRFRNGCKNSRRIWWMMKFHYREARTPVLLMKTL